jgi:hypothetical protein
MRFSGVEDTRELDSRRLVLPPFLENTMEKNSESFSGLILTGHGVNVEKLGRQHSG